MLFDWVCLCEIQLLWSTSNLSRSAGRKRCGETWSSKQIRRLLLLLSRISCLAVLRRDWMERLEMKRLMICRRVLGQTCWMFFHRLVDVGVVLVVDMGVVFVVVDRVDSVDSDNNMKRRIGVAWYISEFQFGQWFPLLHFIVTR